MIGGQATPHLADPPPRRFEMADLADLVAAVKANLGTGAAIFIGEACVMGLLDDTRRERAYLPLHLTPAISTLSRSEPLDHKAFVTWLRTSLAGTIAEDLVQQFRSLKLTRATQTDSRVDVSDEAIGRQINSAVRAGGNPLPETVQLEVQVFEEFPNMDAAQVCCAVLVDFEECTLALRPLPGELTQAIRDALLEIQKDVGSLLGEHAGGVPVYLGYPFGK